jgi:SAM-dependent methyltransferase
MQFRDPALRSVQTPHFCVHGYVVEPRFPLARLDNELTDFIASELGPLGLVPDQKAFERIFVNVVLATAQRPTLAWRAFYRNTLRRLRQPAHEGLSSVDTFARIYARVPTLIRGTRILDVGCCFGFLPMLLAEQDAGLAVVGSDIAPGAVALAGSMAAELQSRVTFLAGDAQRLPFRSNAVDTVLSVHVLEHLPAVATLTAVAELCRVARRRVVVAVPLEASPDPTYGHLQVFDTRALSELGAETGWKCSVHECDGGWLVLDRPTTRTAQRVRR